MEVVKRFLFSFWVLDGDDIGGMIGGYCFDLGGGLSFFSIFFPIVMTRGVTRLCLSVCGIYLWGGMWRRGDWFCLVLILSIAMREMSLSFFFLFVRSLVGGGVVN